MIDDVEMDVTSADREEFRQIKEQLEKAADQEFSGLRPVNKPIVIRDFFREQGRVCVAWIFRGEHTAGRFLGWNPTGREVRVTVLSVGRSTGAEHGPWEIDVHEWDRVAALVQIGVRAVGRPILPGR